MTNFKQTIGRSVRRVAITVVGVITAGFLAYALWHPGLDIKDGRHDRGSNAIWLAHGWLGGDEWFVENNKTNEFAKYRSLTNIRLLAEKLRDHGIEDVFPHLCPAKPNGELPSIDDAQVERFLDAFEGFRVLPWIGGPNGYSVRANDAQWRSVFLRSVDALLVKHPRFAGVHLNVEPLPSGDKDFLLLLDEIRTVLPPGKLLSVAAYPPPTRWHPFPDVHWNEFFFREVARRCDQIVVMMYDTALKIPKIYQELMADWTLEVLDWSGKTSVLLGVPTYEDAGVDYHYPKVENLTNALLGVHRGLSRKTLPTNYQGIAIYCDWETSDSEWSYLQKHFLRQIP